MGRPEEGGIVDAALADLLQTAPFYGPGFANHGPMVIEALEHRGHEKSIHRFLEVYRPQLEAQIPTATAPAHWEAFLRSRLSDLAPHGAAIAGHGLLRVAHATRAVSRVDTAVRRADLDEAIRYWSLQKGIATERRLDGTKTVRDVVAELPRLAPLSDQLMLSASLAEAAQDRVVAASVAALENPQDPLAFLDSLALVSADCYLSNDAAASFAFIHGVTVPVMAQVLVPFLHPVDLLALLSSVAGFVLYAVAAFDQPTTDQPTMDQSTSERPILDQGSEGVLGEQRDLAAKAAETLDDHTIKFTDACLVLATTTSSSVPVAAAAMRIRGTS